MRVWHFGNTTVRSPFRLREFLVALSKAPPLPPRKQGQDAALRQLLGEQEIVTLGEDATNSVGRKWRSALEKMGFLCPPVHAALDISQDDIGQADTLTQNGRRLVSAEGVSAMQECFLRAMAAYFIPSVLEKKYEFSVFSPLQHTLAVMLALQKKTGESRLNFIEMALIVQLTTSHDVVDEVIDNILKLRQRRLQANNKRAFDRLELEAAAKIYNKKQNTFKDYADLNFRYLKATGLVQTKGKGLALVPEKQFFIEKLVQEITIPESALVYLKTLTNGAALPTDNKEAALLLLHDLLKQLKKKGIAFDTTGSSLEMPADIAIVRHKIEELLSECNEEDYADAQANEWEEIAAYMELLNTRKRSKQLSNGDEIEVPEAERPAYFEWILWRAFLAIGHLQNKSYEARRFKIDQDFLPVGTAPGGGPDLVFEFQDFIIVVEVTLTENSRQEAAEGESVRRHVAEWATKSDKPVYGLFIANKIDSNTAETFRIGAWYTKEDSKMRLDIIPMTLGQFKEIFEALFKSKRVDVMSIRALLDQCGTFREVHEAPMWKLQIENAVRQCIEELRSAD